MKKRPHGRGRRQVERVHLRKTPQIQNANSASSNVNSSRTNSRVNRARKPHGQRATASQCLERRIRSLVEATNCTRHLSKSLRPPASPMNSLAQRIAEGLDATVVKPATRYKQARGACRFHRTPSDGRIGLQVEGLPRSQARSGRRAHTRGAPRGELERREVKSMEHEDENKGERTVVIDALRIPTPVFVKAVPNARLVDLPGAAGHYRRWALLALPSLLRLESRRDELA